MNDESRFDYFFVEFPTQAQPFPSTRVFLCAATFCIRALLIAVLFESAY